MSNRNSLWEIKGRGAAHYLLGAVHFLKPEQYPLAPEIERAYGSAAVLMVEADTVAVPAEEMGRLTAANLHYGPGRSLHGSVADRTYDLVERRAAELGLDAGLLDGIKPLALAMIFAHLLTSRAGFDEDLGVDRLLLRRAKADGKEVLPLETAEEQLGFIGGIPPAAQELSLLNTLTSFDKIADAQERINRAWATGDMDALEGLLRESQLRQAPEVNEALIYARNESWLPRIEACLNGDRSYLVAVGVAHLAGERGILRLLGDRGYDPRQL